MRRNGARTSDNAMKAKFACLIKSGAITQEEAYRRASQAVGRTLVPGWGLSTCDHQELIRVLDHVSAFVSGSPVPRRSGSQPDRGNGEPVKRRLPRRADGETRASLPQYHLVRALQEELRLSDQELAAIARQACRKAHPITARDLAKVAEALKAIKARWLTQRRRAAEAGAANG